jgi:hypothetical protein
MKTHRTQTDDDENYIKHLCTLSNDTDSSLNRNIKTTNGRSEWAYDRIYKTRVANGKMGLDEGMDTISEKYAASCDAWKKVKDNVVEAINNLKLAVAARNIAVDKYYSLWDVVAAAKAAAEAESYSNNARNRINDAMSYREKARKFIFDADDLLYNINLKWTGSSAIFIVQLKIEKK